MEKTTEDDIYTAVMEAWAAEEENGVYGELKGPGGDCYAPSGVAAKSSNYSTWGTVSTHNDG